jgi:protein-S-isoprenylcysteine O-methyltransferase Ste14
MSPDSVVQWTWGLWLISWFAAAAWSSRTTGRPNAVGEKLYRVLTAAGAILLFGHPNWRWVAATLWRLGSAAQWTLVAVTMCGLAFTWWARVEENFLRRELGEDRYDAYARRVPMFVPFTRDIHQKI